MTKQLCVVIVVSCLANGALAAGELKTYRCNYERYANGEKIQKVEEPFELIFVNDPSGKVTLVGNQGSSEVMGFWDKAGEGVSFIEVTPGGNIMAISHHMVDGVLDISPPYIGQQVSRFEWLIRNVWPH